jgi:hypothetical protein
MRFSSFLAVACLFGLGGFQPTADRVSLMPSLKLQSFRKRNQLLRDGVGGRLQRTGFVTRGNRAQRARQMAGFMAMS